jgi:bifunctional DNA-binding transcriptional regulator/antitoxin component of YhaV-PrlF toxin-antitoxin module
LSYKSLDTTCITSQSESLSFAAPPDEEFRMAKFEEVRTVTATGQLVIPWVIQRALGLEHGGPVKFRVEDGAVTLLALEPRRTEPVNDMNRAEPRMADSRSALMAELKTLLDAAARDRSGDTSSL